MCEGKQIFFSSPFFQKRQKKSRSSVHVLYIIHRMNPKKMKKKKKMEAEAQTSERWSRKLKVVSISDPHCLFVSW